MGTRNATATATNEGASERQLRRRAQQRWPKLLRRFDQFAEEMQEYKAIHEQLYGAEEVAPAAQLAGAP